MFTEFNITSSISIKLTGDGNLINFTTVTGATVPPPMPVPPEIPRVCDNQTWIQHGRHCYFFWLQRAVPWANSVHSCWTKGSKLVTIHSQEQNDWIQQELDRRQPRYKRKAWMGMIKLVDIGKAAILSGHISRS